MSATNYIVKEIGALEGDECQFIKGIRKEILNAGQGKITCNKTETDIETDYQNQIRPTLIFTILNKVNLFMKVGNLDSSNFNSTETSIYMTTEDVDNEYLEENVQNVYFTSYGYTLPSTTTKRVIQMLFALLNNGIFISFYNYDGTYKIFSLLVLNNNEYCIWTPQTTTSYLNEDEISPFNTSSHIILLKNFNETGWKNVSAIDRLNYVYNPNNSLEFEILRTKSFISSPLNMLELASELLYDCSYCPQSMTIYLIDNKEYLALNHYTLIPLLTANEQEGDG